MFVHGTPVSVNFKVDHFSSAQTQVFIKRGCKDSNGVKKSTWIIKLNSFFDKI